MDTKLTESLVKYLAGLLDADGSLSFAVKSDQTRSDRYFLGLMLGLASSDAVDRKGFVSLLPAITGMGSISRSGPRYQFVTWRIAKRADLEMILPRLIKHMVIKARHWQWLLETWRGERWRSYAGAEVAVLKEASKQSRIERVGPLKPKNHPTWAWLAGYLDGDGWYRRFYQAKPHNYWAMHVGAVAHLNDVSVLHFLRQAFGGNIRDHGQSPNVKVWVRNLGVQDRSFALRFLPSLAKHSRLKREKIDQIIHHHRQRLSAPSPEGQATV